MGISAHPVLPGTVPAIERGAITSYVRIDPGGQVATAPIADAAADGLTLAVGEPVYAVVKASDVMVGKDCGAGAGDGRPCLGRPP